MIEFPEPNLFPKKTRYVALGFDWLVGWLFWFVFFFYFSLSVTHFFWTFFLFVKIFHGMWIPTIDLSTSVMSAENQLFSFLLGSSTLLLAAPVDWIIQCYSSSLAESLRHEPPPQPMSSVWPEFFVHLCLDLHLVPLTVFILWRTLDHSVTKIP